MSSLPYVRLIDELVSKGVLKTPRIIEAFLRIKRNDFLPELMREAAHMDSPLPIGYGQTISQPYTVAFMVELLMPCIGDRVLDIGSGSGWVTSLLAYIVSNANIVSDKADSQKSGKVFAIERVKELCESGKRNIEKYNFITKGVVECLCRDGKKGLARYAPFNGIIAGAAGDYIPDEWLSQLAENGRLIAPMKESIWLYKKTKKGIETKEYPGFLFVPLV